MARKKQGATTYAAPAGWRMPTEDDPQPDHTAGRIDRGAPYRGNLASVEESEIARSHRPVKSSATEKAEHEARAAMPRDTRPVPEDAYPVALHTRAVDSDGKPDWSGAFYRVISGREELPPVAARRLGLILAELELRWPLRYTLLRQRYEHDRSYRDMGREMGIRYQTVAWNVEEAMLWVVQRWDTLYGESP